MMSRPTNNPINMLLVDLCKQQNPALHSKPSLYLGTYSKPMSALRLQARWC